MRSSLTPKGTQKNMASFHLLVSQGDSGLHGLTIVNCCTHRGKKLHCHIGTFTLPPKNRPCFNQFTHTYPFVIIWDFFFLLGYKWPGMISLCSDLYNALAVWLTPLWLIFIIWYYSMWSVYELFNLFDSCVLIMWSSSWIFDLLNLYDLFDLCYPCGLIMW